VVEMAGYEQDGMVGMMVREESGEGCNRMIIIVVGNIHCFQTAHDQNIPYMAGGGSLASCEKKNRCHMKNSRPTTPLVYSISSIIDHQNSVEVVRRSV
jgi:hypothetical protein